MQNKIEVEIKQVEKSWNMFPRYDYESDILEVRNPDVVDWPFGVDIDGNLIFDLDKEKSLVNFDLHIPMQYWEEVDIIRKPEIKSRGVLKFTENTLKIKSFNIPIKVFKNKAANILLVEFGENVMQGYGVKISDACIAILKGKYLVAFYIVVKPI